MKTKIKRHSRAVISVILAISMLISCMMVGLIATDAAKVTGDEAVGADTYYYHYGTGNDYWSSNGNAMTNDGTTWYADVDFTTQYNNYIRVNTTSNSINNSDNTSVSSQFTNNYSSVVNKISYDNNVSSGYAGYKIELKSAPATSTKVRISFDTSDMTKLIVSDPDSGSSGGDDPTPSGETTTVNQTSGKTILVSWDTNTSYVWDYVYFYSGYSTSHNQMLAPVSPNPTATYPQVYYKTLYDSGTDTTAIKFILEEDGSFSGQSANIEPNGFTKGKQWYTIMSSSGHSGKPSPDSNGEYTALKLSSITAPSTLIKDTENSLTVSVDGGLPWFLSSKRSVNTGKYKLTVTDNGTQIFTKDDVLYATKSFTVPWTPSTGGSHTLVYTLTDGIDTVTYSKAYTVIVPEAKHAVTFTSSPVEGGSITPATGTEVGETTPTTITATPETGYQFSGWTFGNGITYGSDSNASTTITTKSSGDYTVTANFTKKPTHKVTVVSNNNAWGTATASVTEAYEGQEVTLTPHEDTGSFSSWSVTSGDVSVSNNKFTMGSSDVAITATFEEYSGNSNFYYNSYGSNGQPASSRYGAQMTEAKIGGQTYSYYHVTGRTEADQLFTVSYESPVYNNYDTYFQFPQKWGGTAEVQFYTTDGKNLGNYTNMTADGEENGKLKWKYHIPDGAIEVQFKHGSDYSGKLSFTSGNNAWYVENQMNQVSGWNSSNPVETNFWENFNSTKYTDAFESKGFNNHNADRGESHAYTKPKDLGSFSSDYYVLVLYKGKKYTINGVEKTITNDPEIIWLPELPDSGDTIRVYAKDGAIRSDSSGATYANIADTKIYAADGTTTVGTKQSGSITNQTYETYKAAKGDTIVIKTTIGATDSSILSNAADLKAKYYVRGFCVNGEVSELLEWNANGLYTLTYKVPEDYEGKNIEITPIYYLKDTEANPIVTYRVTGFTDELKAVGSGKPGWGDTLYTYPFYGKLGGQNNAFGAYPGQPMVYYKGQYQMQIPQKSTAWDPYQESSSTVNNTSVSGVTMSNGYWDSVHKTIMGYGDNSTSADHVQTYDYGDFYKIFNEKKPVDNIVFDFKYRTKKHNFENQPAASTTKSTLDTNYGTNGNGFELLTNFHGRTVDLFGTPLSGAASDPEQTTPVYVVSIGGVNGSAGVENIAGYYATEWMVYGSSDGSNYSRISAGGKNSIPPEVLVLNDDDATSFNTTTYPSAVDTTAKPYKITDWQALYTALEAYRGKPVYISYEAADAQQGQEMYYTGSGGATRNDGRWLYSKNGENITSNIKIQYSDDNGVTYKDLDTTTPQVTGLSAYFTNDGVEGEMTYSTTIDPDKTFDFEAKTTNGNYKFVGWFMEDGTKITSDNASHTERSGSYTFVAKFMQVQSGQLILSHSVDTNDTYKGAGTAKISAVVKNGDEVVRTYDLSTSDITLDDKIIKSDSTYTINVTLEATATGNDALGTTVLANPSGQDSTYFNAASNTTEGKTKTIVLNSFNVASLFSGTTQNVKNIIYHSYFTQVTFHYDLKFEYTDRFGVTKGLYKKGYLTSAQAANENYVKVYDVGNDRNERRLMPAFIEQIAPHVSNFGETITWKIVETGYAFNVQDYEYTLTNVVLANQTKNDKRNVTFNLPYLHTNGIASVDGNKQGTAATTTNFELTGDNAVTYSTIPTLRNDAENGIYTDADKKHWIAAPATINDNGTTKYFQYWSVKRTSASGENDPELARCYFPGFNFVVLENYTITAIYGNQATSISDSGVYTGASYLETSRNQWNTKADSDSSDKDANGDRIAADLLFNDFVLNYNYKGAQLNANEDNGAVQELGVVVERIRELDINQDGSKNTNISNYSSEAENRNTVLSVINNTSSDKKFTKNAIAKTALDNKNRYQFYDAFYNGAGWSLDKQSSATKYAYKNYVFRAYTYIKYTDDQNVTQICLSEKPTYFTMYDEAVADYVAPKTSSTNP